VQLRPIWIEKAFHQSLADSALACAWRNDAKRPEDVHE